MKRFRSITRWGAAALLAAMLFTVPSTPTDAALPKSSCMRDFLGCRKSCRETYMKPGQEGKWIVGGMYGACLFDCDKDLISCVLHPTC